MNDSILEKLLRDADVAAPAPAPGTPGMPGSVRASSDLAARVRIIATRRRTRRRSMAAAGLACAIVACGWLTANQFTTRQTPPPTRSIAVTPPPEPSPEVSQTRLAALQSDIAQHEANVARLLAVEQNRRFTTLRQRLAEEQPLDRLDRQVERAAAIVLQQAQQMELIPHGRDAAVQAYRQIVAHFPDTESAQHAKQRLAELQG